MARLFELTIERGIAAYDAVYLDLASLDQRQRTAAEAAKSRLVWWVATAGRRLLTTGSSVRVLFGEPNHPHSKTPRFA